MFALSSVVLHYPVTSGTVSASPGRTLTQPALPQGGHGGCVRHCAQGVGRKPHGHSAWLLLRAALRAGWAREAWDLLGDVSLKSLNFNGVSQEGTNLYSWAT